MDVQELWIPLLVSLGTIGATGLVFLYWELRLPPLRDLDDLVFFLRTTDMAQAEKLLDPWEEERLREKLSPEEFRAEQRMRVYRLYEIMLRCQRNQALVGSLAFAEWWKIREPKNALEEIRFHAAEVAFQAEIKSRHEIKAALATLRHWIIFGSGKWAFCAPRLHTLREISNGMKGYKAMTVAVVALAMTYSLEWREILETKLLGPAPQNN